VVLYALKRTFLEEDSVMHLSHIANFNSSTYYRIRPLYRRSAAGGADGPDRIFVGGLPYYLTEVQIKELLESFG
jgi:hypothetical protein